MKPIVFLFVFAFSFLAGAQDKVDADLKQNFDRLCTIETNMTGAIGLSSLDLLKKAISKAEEKKCQSVLVNINTPGGSLQTTRMIVEEILNSSIPILCLISPQGAHAGSAGAIIMQACHVNGAMSATNIGAATPIQGSGKDMPEDLRKKMLNDTTSWLDSLTELRGRNQKFGRDIITEAKAVSASEALKLGAIDFVADKKLEFIQFADGQKTKVVGDQEVIVIIGDLEALELTTRDELLALVTNPETAYLLFMGSLGLLYFEITHPGTFVPGVAGAIGLLVSMVALHKMDVQYGGLLLIFLGIALMIAEAFVASFGALGLGGVVAFVAGSLFLFDPESAGGYQLSLSLILVTSLFLGGVTMGIAYLAFKTRNVRRKGGFDDLMGEEAVVIRLGINKKSGQVEVAGETWKFKSERPVEKGQTVWVNNHKGLTLLISEQKKEIHHV